MTYLDEVFGQDGYLSKKLPGYVPRAGQQKMAEEVERSYRSIEFQKPDDVSEFDRIVKDAPRPGSRIKEAAYPLFVEAGTGVGKSFAYLVPAIHNAMLYKVRTLVVTANINMQEQLVKKDLPFLFDALPYRFSYGLQKGVSNYLCVDRHSAQVGLTSEAARFKRRLDLVNDTEETAYRKLIEWGATTRTGDRSELKEEPLKKIWDVLSTSSDDCAGASCGYAKQCHMLRAREHARNVDILVVNYDLFFINQLAEGWLLPDYHAVIMDEGHEAVSVARDRVFGMNVSLGTFTRLISFLKRHIDEKVADGWKKVAATFFASLEQVREESPTWIREPLPEPTELLEVLTEMSGAFSKRIYEFGVDVDRDPSTKTQVKLAERRMVKCAVLANDLKEFVTLGHGAQMSDNRRSIYYVEANRTAGLPAMRSKFISVGHILEPLLRDKTTIITSATLTNADSFDFTLSEFGVTADYRTLVVDTPFNWLNQAFLIVPAGMPNPSSNREAYNAQVCNQIGRAIVLAEGRTLVLTTSYEMMNRAYEYVKNMLRVPYTLLLQGQAPNNQLAQQFREDVSSCLFGTDSFWTGIDIPGEALSCLIIDKLPFPHPDDPVLSFLDYRDGQDAFRRHSIPRAVRKLKQGFGRLIRSVNDHGVVVILDPRVKSESYGSLFLKSLPLMNWSSSIENIPRALEWGAKNKGVAYVPPVVASAEQTQG